MDPINYSEEIDLGKYWLVLRRHWLPSIGVFGTVLILTCGYAFMRSPSYKASGSLMFKTNHTSSLTGVGGDIGRLEALGSQNTPLDTQAEVVKSVPVLEKTIQFLGLKDSKGKALSIRNFRKQLEVKGLPGTDVLQIDYVSDDPKQAATVVNKIMDIYLRENVQSNRSEAASAREFITSQLPQAEVAVRQADLALRRFKEENNVIELTQEAASAVENIASLESQIAEARAQWVNATARANELQNLIRVNPQQAIALLSLNQAPGIQSVLTQYQEVQSQLAVEQMRYRSGHPSITNLQRRVEALNTLLQQRIAQMIGSGQSISVGDLQLGEQRQQLIGELVQAEANKIGLAGQLSALTGARSGYRTRASVLPRLEQTQRELERNQQAAQTNYETLWSRLQEIQLAENQNVGNARVVSLALVPEDPAGVSSKLILAAGSVAGILLAIATAFGMDLLDRSVKTVKQAKDLLGFTVLGIIPNLSEARRNKLCLELQNQSVSTVITRGFLHSSTLPLIITRDFPHSPISEAYHLLQTNLRLSISGKTPRTIVITSSVPKEGKSEVSANLATAIAQSNRRVLLVDADMRCPMQHRLWNLTNTVGLSNVIVEQVNFASAVQEVLPGLHVLPAGDIPPNPVALLDSRRMITLVENFAQEYDFVIFDTPPISGTADTTILGKMVDGILLIVRPEVVDSAHAEAAKEFLSQSEQRVLGMVINGIDSKNEPDGHFYYAGGKTSEWFEKAGVPGNGKSLKVG